MRAPSLEIFLVQHLDVCEVRRLISLDFLGNIQLVRSLDSRKTEEPLSTWRVPCLLLLVTLACGISIESLVGLSGLIEYVKRPSFVRMRNRFAYPVKEKRPVSLTASIPIVGFVLTHLASSCASS